MRHRMLIAIALAPILAGAQEPTSRCPAGASCTELLAVQSSDSDSVSLTLRLVFIAVVIVAGLAWYGRRRAATDE